MKLVCLKWSSTIWFHPRFSQTCIPHGSQRRQMFILFVYLILFFLFLFFILIFPKSMVWCKTAVSSALSMEILQSCTTLQWHHNGHNGVSNHQPHDCLLNRLFRSRSKKTSKLHVTGICARSTVNSLHKWPVTQKMFPFDDVIMKPPKSKLAIYPCELIVNETLRS